MALGRRAFCKMRSVQGGRLLPVSARGVKPARGMLHEGVVERQAVVIAGGLATRMRPLTLTVPKAMLEVGGRPFVDWQLERLAEQGIRDVVMCVAHLAEVIEAHVGDGSRYGVRVRWAHEGKTLLGTAGAVRAALDLLAPTFLVTYGDSYLPFDYAEPLRILEAHADDCDGVMAVYKNDGAFDASNVVTDGTWVQRYEKGSSDPAFDSIDYGATAIKREIIAALPAGEKAGLDAIQHALARRKRLRACMARERFFEIGSPEGLGALDQHLRQRTASR
jgi:MurNAc alpha-1-phosphate uridylyltransferase